MTHQQLHWLVTNQNVLYFISSLLLSVIIIFISHHHYHCHQQEGIELNSQ